jgi:hypothetical protein
MMPTMMRNVADDDARNVPDDVSARRGLLP